jgi:hypothetical protein
MEFRLEFTPRPFEQKISLHDRILLAGSCFTEQIGSKLALHKFNVLENPNGILFNPLSLSRSITGYITNKHYTVDDLFLSNEIWGSWDHHTRFSSVDQDRVLDKINASQQQAHEFLRQADWLMLTLGSAFAYELSNGEIVANCHKVPADKFNKRLLPVPEIMAAMDELIHRLRQFNPSLQVIFTISPVRHLRDGFVENNRSKANLIQSVHQLVEKFDRLYYFPAYELIIDDLRDYRFYAEDMVHPNYAATNYVWEKFVDCCIDTSTQGLMKELYGIQAAKSHKPFNPSSRAHLQFLEKNLANCKRLQADHPYLDLSKEISFFQQQLIS